MRLLLGNECREVSSTSIARRRDGYIVKKTREVVGYKDGRLRRSPDGCIICVRS